tara:strand:+ start:16903 stop:17664 length:762 start_codon:yes stop_codon:yes gene_type:complete
MRYFVFVVIMFSSLSAGAWGMIGHRVVGQVAEEHLSETAQKKVNEILGTMTLAEVSNWMDDIKSDSKYDSLRPWHYTTIPDGKTYKDITPSEDGDVVQGIKMMVEGLKSGELSPKLEREYLMILVHLVGDVHQPLHVGNGEDRGGNDVKVEWFWDSSNLHRVWDSGIIDSKQYSYTELTNLVNHPTEDEVTEWQSSTVEDWANECLEFRDGIYDLPANKKINYEYRHKHWRTVKSQLAKGGVRLAGLLNEIYG